MPLSCKCDVDYDWWYIPHSDYAPLKTKRCRKCWSCGNRIAVGDLSVRCDKYREPNNDIEERIYGDEVETAPGYLCERCGDLYYSLEDLGFCIDYGEDMRELVKEYAATYGKKAA